jgi:hypothetical protein
MTRTASVLSLALGLLLAGPVEAKPHHPHKTLGAHPPIERLLFNALAPEMTVRWPAPFIGATPGSASSSRPETDGLSRNPDDCNYGCIDNGGG